MLTGIFATLCFFNFASFAWSVIGVFKKHSDQDKTLYRLLQIGSVLTWATSFYSICSATNELIGLKVLGLISVVLSFCCFWISANSVKFAPLTIVFSHDKPNFIHQKGPYKFVRHPFYLSYVVCYFGVAFFTLMTPATVAAILMTVIYFYAAKLEEAKFANSDLAGEYAAYSKKAGMFFPRLFS